MKRPNKWVPDRSKRITTYGDFEDAVRAGKTFFVDRFFKDRAVSGRVVGNMSFLLVTHLIHSHKICVAKQSELYREWLRAELLGWDAGEHERLVFEGSVLLYLPRSGQ